MAYKVNEDLLICCQQLAAGIGIGTYSVRIRRLPRFHGANPSTFLYKSQKAMNAVQIYGERFQRNVRNVETGGKVFYIYLKLLVL